MGRIKDRTGTITSTGIKIISDSGERYRGEILWNCECPVCHKIWIVRSSHLNGPKPITMCKDCSSLKALSTIQTPFYKDLTGQRFGKLVALERTNKKGSKTYFWKCQCDCGNICEKEAQYLLNGDTKSCGCLRSKGENLIASILRKNHIQFEQEKILFKKYRFDFYVDNSYVIEFDGRQHFEQLVNRESLENIHKRDLEKDSFCFKNNIPLIRIPYYHYDNLSIDNLILSTSKFIIMEGKENEYYRTN